LLKSVKLAGDVEVRGFIVVVRQRGGDGRANARASIRLMRVVERGLLEAC
jgi:hypothetical protein